MQQVNHYFDKVNAKKKNNNNNNNIIKTNVSSPNPVTIYKLYSTKKVIVWSPQPDDVGKLIEWDKICKNEKKKCKRQGSSPAIKSFGLWDLSGVLYRFAAGRLREEGCSC